MIFFTCFAEQDNILRYATLQIVNLQGLTDFFSIHFAVCLGCLMCLPSGEYNFSLNMLLVYENITFLPLNPCLKFIRL